MSAVASKQPTESAKYLRMIASLKGVEAKRLSRSIVPGGNLWSFRKCHPSIVLMNAEIIVRIFNKTITCRAMPGRRLVLPLGLRPLWFDRRRGFWLRLVIFGRKINCRYFRQGLLLRSRRERFRDADGLGCLERRTL